LRDPGVLLAGGALTNSTGAMWARGVGEKLPVVKRFVGVLRDFYEGSGCFLNQDHTSAVGWAASHGWVKALVFIDPDRVGNDSFLRITWLAVLFWLFPPSLDL
jgi:hypothetical protein